MKHKFKSLKYNGKLLSDVLQKRLDKVNEKIEVDFPMIYNLKDRDVNFLSMLYQTGYQSEYELFLINSKSQRSKVVKNQIEQDDLSFDELKDPKLIAEAVDLINFLINDFVFELGVDKDGLATEYKLDESEGVTVANVAFAGIPIFSECIFSKHPMVVPRDVVVPLNYINPFNKNFSQDYFCAIIKNDIEIIYDSLTAIVEKTVEFSKK